MLYKKHRFWCFSFVTLFNLQGTRPSASAAERTLSYHVGQLSSSTFFNFFEVFSALASAFRRSLRQLIKYIRASRVCQALFSLRFEVSRCFPFGLPPFSDSLSSISELPEVVKHFFHFVEIFFALSLARPPRFRQLAYYIRHFPICQQVSSKFSNFFSSPPKDIFSSP